MFLGNRGPRCGSANTGNLTGVRFFCCVSSCELFGGGLSFNVEQVVRVVSKFSIASGSSPTFAPSENAKVDSSGEIQFRRSGNSFRIIDPKYFLGALSILDAAPPIDPSELMARRQGRNS